MKPIILCYPKCSTCKKAEKWLKENEISFEQRDITVENPTKTELEAWIELSGLPVSKFFNTSGLKYRALNMKDRIKTASTEELIDLLASDGMLVKRPLLVCNNDVLVGFKEEQWTNLLK